MLAVYNLTVIYSCRLAKQ